MHDNLRRATWHTFHEPRYNRKLVHFHQDAAALQSETVDDLLYQRKQLQKLDLFDVPRLSPQHFNAHRETAAAEYEIELLTRENELASTGGYGSLARRIVLGNTRRITDLQLRLLDVEANTPEPWNPEDPVMLTEVLYDDPLSLSPAELSILWQHHRSESTTHLHWQANRHLFHVYRLSLPTIELPASLSFYLGPLVGIPAFLLFMQLGRDLRPSRVSILIWRFWRTARQLAAASGRRLAS